MNRFWIALLLILVAVPALAWSGRVVRVPDGDDLRVLRVQGAKREVVEIRLHGIDAPEKKQPFGMQAKKANAALSFGKVVEVKEVDTDRYGRTVAEIILPDKTNLSQTLVYLGMAWWYQKYAPKDKTLQNLETAARKTKIGLWHDVNPIPPWQWRRNKANASTLLSMLSNVEAF